MPSRSHVLTKMVIVATAIPARVFSLSLIMSLSVAAAQSGQGIPPPKDSHGIPLATEFRFEVVSVRPLAGQPASMRTAPGPGGYSSALTTWQMLMVAYGPSNIGEWGSGELLNAPGWLGDWYEINGRVSQADLNAWQHQSKEQELLRSAIRAMLRDRFRLTLHQKASKGSIFDLVTAKGGPRLKPTVPVTAPPNGVKLESGGFKVGNRVEGKTIWDWHEASREDLAGFLSTLGGIPVRDKTGLTGRYDFQIRDQPRSPEENRVYIFPVDHLGLQLKSGSESRPALVIDHIEKPTPN